VNDQHKILEIFHGYLFHRSQRMGHLNHPRMGHSRVESAGTQRLYFLLRHYLWDQWKTTPAPTRKLFWWSLVALAMWVR
jgi:hypothetical protein